MVMWDGNPRVRRRTPNLSLVGPRHRWCDDGCEEQTTVVCVGSAGSAGSVEGSGSRYVGGRWGNVGMLCLTRPVTVVVLPRPQRRTDCSVGWF